MTCNVKFTVTSVRAEQEQKSKSLFASASKGELKWNRRHIKTLESGPVLLAKLADIQDIFPRGGWINLTADDSHFVPGAITIPEWAQFFTKGKNAVNENCLEVSISATITKDGALKEVELGKKELTYDDFMRSTKRAVSSGQLFDRHCPFEPVGYIMMVSTTVSFGERIDVSSGANRVSAVALPMKTNCYRSVVPPRMTATDIRQVSVALSERDIAVLFATMK